jgi:acyl-CoA oxidase
MLNLIEAFEFDDNIMVSAIGNYDGNVYERLMDWARSSRLNDKDVLPGFNEHIRPF